MALETSSESRNRDPATHEGQVAFLQELLRAQIDSGAKQEAEIAELKAVNRRLTEENHELRQAGDARKREFHARFAQAQAEFKDIYRDISREIAMRKGGAYQLQYADLPAVLDAVLDSLTARGISCRQPIVDATDGTGRATLRTVFTYDGYEETFDISLDSPAQHQARCTDVREFGSNVSLIRRYALCAALGVAPKRPATSSAAKAQSGPSRSSTPFATPAVAVNELASAQSVRRHPSLDAATSLEALTAAMNALPQAHRQEYTPHFKERRREFDPRARA